MASHFSPAETQQLAQGDHELRNLAGERPKILALHQYAAQLGTSITRLNPVRGAYSSQIKGHLRRQAVAEKHERRERSSSSRKKQRTM